MTQVKGTKKQRYSWYCCFVKWGLSLGLADAEGDTSFAHIVGRYLDAYLVTNDEADETLAHFARDVGEELVTIGNFDAEHGSCKNGGDNTLHFDFAFTVCTFFDAWTSKGIAVGASVTIIPVAILRSSTAVWWFCHLIRLLLRVRARVHSFVCAF